MLLLHNLHVFALKGEFEQSDSVVGHELCGNGAACQAGEFLNAAGNVLAGLGNAELIRASLGLDGNDKLLTVPVHAYVYFVDFDLSHVLDEGLQVVLQRITGYAEKYVDQPVIANLGEKRLLVGERVGGDNFRRRVRYFYGDEIGPGTMRMSWPSLKRYWPLPASSIPHSMPLEAVETISGGRAVLNRKE